MAPGDVAQPRQGLPEEPARRARIHGAVGGRHLGAPRVSHGPGQPQVGAVGGERGGGAPSGARCRRGPGGGAAAAHGRRQRGLGRLLRGGSTLADQAPDRAPGGESERGGFLHMAKKRW